MCAEIVSLSERRKLFQHPALVQVEAYWDGLRAGRDMPARAEIDPRGIQDALSHCFILERIAPGMARFRVAGRVLAQSLGIELQGMPISIAFDMASRDILEDALERVFARPEIVRLGVSTRLGIGRGKLEGQMLFLPLRDDMGRVTRIFGGVAVTSGMSEDRRHARRFTIDSVTPREIPLGQGMVSRPTRLASGALPADGVRGEVVMLQPHA